MGKLSKCLQKSPTSLLQCWSQRHVEVVALEQISPVLVLRVKSSVCSLPTEQPVCESLTPSIAAVPRICHPLRRVRVRSGAWRVSGSGVFTQRESALCFTREQTAGSGVFVWSDFCSHGVCSLLGSVRFRWRKWRWSILIVEVVGCHLTSSVVWGGSDFSRF